MKPFRYERASGVASACASAAKPAAKFIAGGTNLLDLMKLQIEAPAASRRYQRAAAWRHRRNAGGRPAHRRAGDEQRARRRHERAAPISAPVAGDPGRCVWAASQQGDHWRQSASAHALPVLLRYHQALQQTRAWLRLRGAPRPQPHERRAGRERQLHRRASVRHGRRHDCARCARRDHRARRRDPHHPDRRALSRARRYAEYRNGARAGRADPIGGAAAAARRAGRSIAKCATARPMRLPWFRSPPSSRTTTTMCKARVSPSAASPTSRGDRRTPKGALSGAALGRASYDAAGTAALKNAHGYGHNDFKIPLARRTLRAALAEATGTI